MNWLDRYIVENETGYFKDKVGGYWVRWDEDTVRFALGERDLLHVKGAPELQEITQEEFISRLLAI